MNFTKLKRIINILLIFILLFNTRIFSAIDFFPYCVKAESLNEDMFKTDGVIIGAKDTIVFSTSKGQLYNLIIIKRVDTLIIDDEICPNGDVYRITGTNGEYIDIDNFQFNSLINDTLGISFRLNKSDRNKLNIESKHFFTKIYKYDLNGLGIYGSKKLRIFTYSFYIISIVSVTALMIWGISKLS